MIGQFGHKTANYALNNTDLLIIIGARVGDRAVTAPDRVEEKSRTIHIDVDPGGDRKKYDADGASRRGCEKYPGETSRIRCSDRQR